MGLDIKVLSDISPLPNATFDEKNYVFTDEHGNTYTDEECWYSDDLKDQDEAYPGRSLGIIGDQIYKYQASSWKKIGCYQYYSQWCDKLREHTKNLNTAFDELLNFTDCEGVLGPVVCRKLKNDFKLYKKYIKIENDRYFWNTYNKFADAFKLAGRDGIVIFM